jgi:hypothetical protein
MHACMCPYTFCVRNKIIFCLGKLLPVFTDFLFVIMQMYSSVGYSYLICSKNEPGSRAQWKAKELAQKSELFMICGIVHLNRGPESHVRYLMKGTQGQ